MKFPTDPYSNEWMAFWTSHPHLHRGVGAEAVSGAESGTGDTSNSGTAGTSETDTGKEAGKNATAGTTGNEGAGSAGAGKAGTDDWRSDLPDDLKETANRFTSKADAVRAIIDLRKRESQVRVPGKDATPEQIAAYHKAIGVPEKPELYEFPDLPEGMELTDSIKESRAQWSNRFHKLGISKETAKVLSAFANEDAQRSYAAQVEADKAFVAKQEEALRAEWKGNDYERNKTLANRAFAELANRTGLKLDELTRIETKDGRFLMDRADIVRIFATLGREMSEGTLGPTLTESEKETMDDQLRSIRSQVSEAQAAGDSKRANKLYQQEQALISKRDGSKPIVGARGRMV